MPRPYSSATIANTFLERYGESGHINHMKLQKLVYFTNGWWLTQFNGSDREMTPLTDDGPEVWQYGPVFPDIYQAFRYCGRDWITEVKSGNPFRQPETIDEDDREVSDLIDWVWKRYGHLPPRQLSGMAHGPGSAWHQMAEANNCRIRKHTRIPCEFLIRDEEFVQ